MTMPRVEQWEGPDHKTYWRSFCEDCTWDSYVLPFPNPDAALHALHLHKVLCEGSSDDKNM